MKSKEVIEKIDSFVGKIDSLTVHQGNGTEFSEDKHPDLTFYTKDNFEEARHLIGKSVHHTQGTIDTLKSRPVLVKGTLLDIRSNSDKPFKVEPGGRNSQIGWYKVIAI